MSVQITARDERIFDWLKVVRLADTEAVRWVLAALDGRTEPVSTRRAQQWIARAVSVGLVEKARPVFRDGTVIWLSRALSERVAPNLYRATTRHEVAVSSISARFLAAGYSWARDRPARSRNEHAADGVAIRGGLIELVEVELTSKTLDRYQVILTDHARRLTDTVHRIVYVGTPAAMRTVERQADKWLHPALRDRIITLAVLDERGHITGQLAPLGNDRVETILELDVTPEPELRPDLLVWGGRD